MRESYRVRNTTSKAIAIGDLANVPVIPAGSSSDLALYQSADEIKGSSDLATLLATGWLILSKASTRITKSLDVVETDELETSDASARSDLLATINALNFVDLNDVSTVYAGNESFAVVVRPDALGLTFSEVTTGAPTGLNDIPDVTITSPTNNQRLIYDADSGQWINRTTQENIVHVSSTPFTLSEALGVYLVDTSSGDIIVNIPVSGQFNDANRVRIFKDTTDANTVTVQVTGLSQDVGNITQQVIDQGGTGLSLLSDYNSGSGSKWAIIQDSRIGLRTRVVTSSDTLTPSDQVVLADATSGNLDIILASPRDELSFTIKKIDTTNAIVTVLPSYGELIDGQDQKQISTPYNSIHLVSDGTDWFIL